jgi:hypothetical protein
MHVEEGHHWVPLPASHSPNPHTNLLNVFIQIANNKGILKKIFQKTEIFTLTAREPRISLNCFTPPKAKVAKKKKIYVKRNFHPLLL